MEAVRDSTLHNARRPYVSRRISARRIVRRTADPELLERLPGDLDPLLRRIYAARGVNETTLTTSLRALLPVGSLDGTETAAARLLAAREAGERVLVVGDFDADGATAAALTVTCLRGFGFTAVNFLVPDRARHGYGLSAGIVAIAARHEPGLIVTVDNGISSLDGVDAAAAAGIDVIITDHHLPGDQLPSAAAIVNPNLPASQFASKALAGVGVAFYLMAATGQLLAGEGLLDSAQARQICADCLDLVALGTVADLVPLDHNNRVLVAQGLKRIRAGRTRPGIIALFETAGIEPRDAAAADFGFRVAPQLNAAGRLDDMRIGIECLLSSNVQEARQLARQLAALNSARRELQQHMQDDAEKLVDELERQGDTYRSSGPDCACLFDGSWHQGVVGLVATRVKDRLNRPVVAFARGERAGLLKGSARSVPGVHIRDVLATLDARHPGMIERFGGHAMAAGLSLELEQLDAFRAAFADEMQALRADIVPDDQVATDGELAPGQFALPTAELLRHSGPWGQGFPEPLFDGCFEVLEQRVVGQRHLKLRLRPQAADSVLDAIAFNQSELDLGPDAQCRAAFRLDVNEFRGRRSAQLVVEQINSV